MSALRPFGELESAVMDRLWSAERPLPVRDVLEQLQGERPLAYTTVMTVMDNLHRKGWLTREMAGRAYLYRPAASREAYAAGLMSQAFNQADDPTATLIHFIEAMSPDEAAALRRALGHQAGAGGEGEQ
ncbi:MAG: BlaI/MecI/CopY family transcriptional regulator [Acidimicrobiales bacterium]